ncbi:ethylene-responsive nuclear family protein [Striga asiatica]|uniref:Ethylene-responsive nuclear family protein n=1 Tax=Striga asiatica TaxID=4170 RepID=A0A5A7NVV4_STRAF|nr:ethylene-responsive nuclear family protein [Striga asiatica]
MHLPWRKVKTARISQFVNDHLSKSQKRRDVSSLVVETGFPTSLVDLFIKNREKLKKPSKRKNRPRDPPIAGSDASYRSASPEIPPAIGFPPPRVPPNSPQPLPRPREVPVENLMTRSNNNVFDGGECVAEYSLDVNKVLLLVVKMFFIVVLALGTKRLTIGFTISAFLLCFIEYACKHSSVVLKPCSQAKGALKSTLFGVLRLLRLIEVIKMEQDNSIKPPVLSRHENREGIQVVESNGYLVKHVLDEIQPEDDDEIIEEEGSSHEASFGHQEIEFDSIEKDDSKRKLRKFKLKMKMERFVPKKLKGGGRKEHGQQSVVGIVREDTNFISSTFVSSREYKEVDDNTIVDRVSCELISKRGEKGEEIKGGGLNCKPCVLCVIVLAGLIGNRVLAVLLVLSWFLVLKLGENLQRCMKKVCL